MSTIRDAYANAAPIKGTRYHLGSFTPSVGLSARPRTIYVLLLDGVEVNRGSKSDLLLMAKSAPGSPLGVCHAQYDRIVELAALQAATPPAPTVFTDPPTAAQHDSAAPKPGRRRGTSPIKTR